MKIAVLEDDHEYHAILTDMLKELGFPHVRCFSSIKEIEAYNKISEIDLLIADYFLGKGSLVSDLLKSNVLPKKTKVIVVTNYFEDSVYEELAKLRKIFFLKKGLGKLELKNALQNTIESDFQIELAQFNGNRFFVKIGTSLKPIEINDIEFFEVDGKYVNVNTVDSKVYPVRSTLTELSYKLPENFIRVHAAFIVNVDYIDSVALNEKSILVKSKTIPFSRTYKKKLFSSIIIA